MEKHKAPTDLTILAVISLLCGIGGIHGIYSQAVLGRLYIDLNVLGIPTFFGLRSFSRGWRTYALVWTWIYLIFAPIIVYLASASAETVTFSVFGAHFTDPTTVDIFGFHLTDVSKTSVIVAGGFLFGFALWQYHVLTRPGVRALFYPVESA